MEIMLSKNVCFALKWTNRNMFLFPTIIMHDNGWIRSIEVRFLYLRIYLMQFTMRQHKIRFGVSKQFRYGRLVLDVAWLDYDLFLFPTFIVCELSDMRTIDFRFLFLMITLPIKKSIKNSQ